MTEPAFYAELRALRVDRVLDASADIIAEEGWDGLSMTAIAKRAGIPRQSLYKAVGTKEELGRAVVDREVSRFLATVSAGIAAHPDSVEEGLAAAARGVLEHGRANAIVGAVLRPSNDAGLLALVTVDPDAVLSRATNAVTSLLGESASEAMVDTVVRLTTSHLLQPTVDVEKAVDRIRQTIRGFR
ncbi:hypothetical protein GCM10027169_32580 [Gordonia jinhuaensis]|uniref:HTH tetR-type domain-containing protein n=1 Tax=Gordonia jinhuaensis TaxID=1517702 RepID=A0A916T5X5_9ACTN|nr:TetR family transcriptional regulator [Gordonia jinhuaensis]GGB33221.1 hypothetical protein GCM10011489_21720 [Gordonia jinhuaensis]